MESTDDLVLYFNGITNDDYVCLMDISHAFDPKDEWLPAFVFRNFGVAGNVAIWRMIKRIQTSERQKMFYRLKDK